MAQCLLHVSVKLWDAVKAGFKIFIRRNVICHLAIIIFFICIHIKVSGSSKSEQDCLFLSCLFTFHCLVNGNADRMAALRCREYAFYSCKLLRRLKYRSLLN